MQGKKEGQWGETHTRFRRIYLLQPEEREGERVERKGMFLDRTLIILHSVLLYKVAVSNSSSSSHILT